jgi:hypothetical protein
MKTETKKANLVVEGEGFQKGEAGAEFGSGFLGQLAARGLGSVGSANP